MTHDRGMSAETKVGQPLLACNRVTKTYGSLVAVDGMELSVNAGEIVGIGGPNGAGKTTFFDIISGVTGPTNGTITFRGEDISTVPADKVCHRGIAKTFQLNAAFESMTVEENVLCSGYFGQRPVLFPRLGYPPRLRREVEDILGLTGLRSVAHQAAGGLPVLLRKKLMIACALATHPALLLMDEPVGGLNPKEIDETIALVDMVRQDRGLTIVLIEHVMRFIVELCDRVVIMHHGQKLFEGTADGLTRDPAVVEVFLGEAASRRLEHLMKDHPHHA